jgi:lipid-binding SYLF domain-containing protein
MEKKTTRKERTMKRKTVKMAILLAVVALYLGLMACATAPKTQAQKEERQASVHKMASQTLADLYKKKPAVQAEVEKAAGYAVFSDFGMKLSIMGGVKGKGVAINNATKQDTFMEMAEFQPGFGIGAEKFRVVILFDTPAAFNSFVTSGWEAGVNAMAAARTKTRGGALAGAVTVSEGVHMFQVDTEGLIVGFSITAAKFYKDKELN